MLYRLALTIGLVIVPLSSAQAAYQQHYTLSENGETATQNVKQVTSTGSEKAMTGSSMQSANETMTRAEFTAILVHSLYTQTEIDNCFASIAPNPAVSFSLLFTDVSVTDPYAKEICLGMRDGLLRGYTDGSFVPDRIITFAESAKILSRTFVLAPFADSDLKSPWYMQHVRALLVRNIVPITITRLSQPLTVDELNEMLDRLEHGITWRPSQTESLLFPVIRLKTTTDSSNGTSMGEAASVSSRATTTSLMPSSKRPSSTSSAMSSQAPLSSSSSKESFWHLF